MEEHLILYFQGEKAESLFVLILGGFFGMLSVWLLVKTNNFFLKGLAYPMMLLALLQLERGSTVYFKTDAQASELVGVIDEVSVSYREVERMEELMARLSIYKWAEFIGIVMGAVLLLGSRKRTFWTGVGLGLMIQGSIMLSCDLLSENRADVYLKELKKENTIFV